MPTPPAARTFYLFTLWVQPLKRSSRFVFCWLWALGFGLAGVLPGRANIPGGGTGVGPAVTLVNNGNGTVTLANGIMTLVITTNDANINQIYYTYNNSGAPVTNQLLAGGTDGGQLYWTGNNPSFGDMNFNYSVVANNPGYAEIALNSTTTNTGIMEVHYSLLRGSSGFYTTAILTHRSQDTNVYITLRPNIYAGSQFNWMSVDTNRNRLMEVSGGLSIPVQGAPKECYLWTNGIYAGQYEDKYKYSADLDSLPAWGWSSVGAGGSNVGIWNITASPEYYPGGPMERSLMEHIGTTILNVFTGGYYGLATDATIGNVGGVGEPWSKVYGPYFYYCNNITNTITATNQAAQALYADALAQGAAEQSAWPYAWFTNANYTPAAGRGAVQGRLVISDPGNPGASAANLWVGVVPQPNTNYDFVYDFQQWARPYQFWVKTDTNGNFTIPNVIAGTNYTLYAFGPGTPDTFLSQAQMGGSPPLIVDYPTNQFSVTVTGGATNNLGTNYWVPTRVGATVFEIGYPDRTAAKFRHGDDYWVGDIGPTPTAPSPVWSKWLEYPFDFPNGVNYVVGENRWSTDWNFIQPVTTDSEGNYNSSSSTITFNLATAPTNGATASLYLGLCSDYYAEIIVSVNNVNAASLSGLAASPNPDVPSTGYGTAYSSSDSNIREGNNGAFTDERLTFSAGALHAGLNTINLGFRQAGVSTPPGYFADHFMYDYIRLELTGYVPPPPAGVTAYAGDNCNLVCWPVAPGATSYEVLRSTTAGTGYAPIATGVAGPVCGSGSNNAVYLDATAANGTTYYYVVQSVNPTGASANSPQSAAATPSSGISAAAPAAPLGLMVAGSGHQSVTLSWAATAGADFYSVWRSTLMNNGGGASNTLSTIILNNNVTNTIYTDTTPTDGSLYTYFVTATAAGGTSPRSSLVAARPLPAAPASAPISLTATFVETTNITLAWTAVPGAVGYAIYRATNAAGPFLYLQTVTETTYTDYGLNAAGTYYYNLVAVNAGGLSGAATNFVNGLQAAPASLAALGTNAGVLLAWPAAAGATSYTIKRGTSAGNETVVVAAGYAGTTYTNSGLVNGTTYYYVVSAAGTGGASGNSPEASATADPLGNGTWIANASGNWSTGTDWSGNQIALGSGFTADFSTLNLYSNLTVTLDTSRTISGLKFGDEGASNNWTLTGTNPLTLGANPQVEVVNQSATISAVIAGTSGLSKTGLGALTLNGASETFTNGLTVNAGSLTLDYSAPNSPSTNLIAAVNSLTLGGGTLVVNGASGGNVGQSFASTVLNAGGSVINLAANGAASLTDTLGGISEAAGGTVEFIGPATINGAVNVAAAGTNYTTSTGSGASTAILGNFGVGANGAWATVGLYDWAATTNNGTYNVIVGGSQVSGFYQTAGINTAGNYDVNPSGVNSLGNAGGAATLRFNNSKQATITFTATTAQNIQGILVTPNMGSTNANLSGDGLEFIRSTGYGNCYGVVWQNNVNAYLNFSSIIEGGRQAGQYNGLVQAGPGTVVYTGSGGNNYELGTYLDGGFSVVNADGDFGLAANASMLYLNGGTVVGNASFAMANAGSNPRPVTLLGNGGGLAATAGNTLTLGGLVGSATGTGPLIIGIPASGANGNVAGLLPGSGAGTANAAPVYATGTVVLTNANYYTGGTVLESGTLNINGLYALGGGNYGGLTFNGGTLQYAAGLTGNNGSADLTSIGTAGITLAAGGGTVDLNGNAVTYANSIGNNGNGSLTVSSSLTGGSLSFQSGNNYSGATTITNATLIVNNPTGSGTGSGDVFVQNNATLSGRGAMAGSVNILSGGTLAAGIPSNSLAIGNNLTLSGGSTTTFQIQSAPAANSSLVVSNTVSFGGALIVTNVSGSLAGGDTFQLFTANKFSGAFSSLTLPALGANLFWNTNLLYLDGALTVASPSTPVITAFGASGANFYTSGSGGIPAWNYYVLTATNLAAPVWLPVATNQFNASGDFSFTNAVQSGDTQRFFRLQVQ